LAVWVKTVEQKYCKSNTESHQGGEVRAWRIRNSGPLCGDGKEQVANKTITSQNTGHIGGGTTGRPAQLYPGETPLRASKRNERIKGTWEANEEGKWSSQTTHAKQKGGVLDPSEDSEKE